ncbi:MAG: contractile injection system tape measure protein, partial [Roseiarcus sp.]
ALRAARVRTGAPAPAEFGAAAAPARAPGRMPAGQGDAAHALARPRAARETGAATPGPGRDAAAAVAARLRAAADRKDMVDGLVERAPRRFLPRVLRALVPAHAGFVETVLIAVAAVEAELSPPRADPRGGWRLALMLVLAAGGAPFDLRKFVAGMVAGMAAARSLPPRAYLDRLDQRAQGQSAIAPRHAPLVEIIAAIRASTPAAAARDRADAGLAPAGQPDRDAEAVVRFLRGAAPPGSPDWPDEAAFVRRVAAMVRSWRDVRLWSAWREPPAEPGVRPGFAARLRWLFGAVHKELGGGAVSGADAPTPAGHRLLRYLRADSEAGDVARRSLRAIAFRTLARRSADFDALLALVAADPRAAPDRLLALFARPPPGAAAAERTVDAAGEVAAARGGAPPGAFDRQIAVLAHVVAFDDRPWWDAARAGATIGSALFDPLERDPRATLAALRGADRPRLARALVRYAPIGALRRLVDQLSPGLAGPFTSFVSTASDRARAFGADLAEAPWRIGFETLLSERIERRFDRFVEAMNARIAREPGLPPALVESIVRDSPQAERRAEAIPSTRGPAREAAARADEDAALFGAPIVFDAAPPDPLQLLRHLLRYGSLPPGSAGVDALEARLDQLFSTSPTAARRLILDAIGRPLSRRNMSALLSPSALRRIGELVLSGDNGLALELVSDLFRAGALPEPGSGAVVHEALFRAAARMGRAARPQPLIREILADVAAFEGRDADTTLRSWRAALAGLVPPSAAADRILRGLEAGPVAARRPAPGPAAPTRAPREPTIAVGNAGIVLLGPHFGTLFDRLGLLDGGTFRDAAARASAIDLLRYLVFGAVETREYALALDKILCGMELAEPLAAGGELGESDRATCDGLLRSVTQSWPPLRNSSIATLREAFLQREGLLRRDDEQWILKVAAKPYDMLLDSVPWPYKLLKTKWMRRLVRVEWR